MRMVKFRGSTTEPWTETGPTDKQIATARRTLIIGIGVILVLCLICSVVTWQLVF